MNFSEELLQSAEASLQRIETAVNRLRFLLKDASFDLSFSERTVAEVVGDLPETLQGYLDAYFEAMDDDLNTADALGTIFELVRYVNRELDPSPSEQQNGNGKHATEDIAPSEQYAALALLIHLTDILGLTMEEEASIPEHVLQLVEARTQAKAEKNYAEADRIRDEITEAGYEVRDTPQGPQLESL